MSTITKKHFFMEIISGGFVRTRSFTHCKFALSNFVPCVISQSSTDANDCLNARPFCSATALQPEAYLEDFSKMKF